jgi:glycosyltransferase involved in cell wall biosynthesis
MKIGIIARGLTKGGVARFLHELFTQISLDKTNSEIIIFTDDIQLKQKYPSLHIVVIKAPHKLLWDYFASKKEIRKHNCDVLLYTKNIIPFTHTNISAKKCVIVHDLAYFEKRFAEYPFLDTLYMKTQMNASCVRADRILTASNATKNDILTTFKIPTEKISVITLSRTLPAPNKTFTSNLKNPYFFYCGSLSPRKNMLRVMQAFKQIKNLVPHHFYLSAGQSWNDKPVREYIKKHLSDRVTYLGFVSDAELHSLYQDADAFIFPSLFEGFGLSIIEAQAAKTPLLTSNVTSCPEIAGDGALIVDPLNVGAIAKGMLDLVNDKSLRKDLDKKGSSNTNKYTSKRMYVNIMNALNE